MRALLERLIKPLNMLLFKTFVQQDRVHFKGCGSISVDLDEARGRLIAQRAGVTQPEVTWAWRQLARAIRPNLVLDVGANYGEIGFSANYGGAVVLLIEGNGRLIPHLERSAAGRALGHLDRFVIVPELVSDRLEEVQFWVNQNYSGTSTMGKGAYNGNEYQVERRSTRTIDDLVQELLIDSPKRILFKIDVEGYEPAVLRGMSETLSEATVIGGIVEYNEDGLLRSGTTPDAFMDTLKAIGSVHQLHKERPPTAIITEQLPTVKKSDILVTRGISDFQTLFNRAPYWFLPTRVVQKIRRTNQQFHNKVNA
jgi:FkbM family methyltransferase